MTITNIQSADVHPGPDAESDAESDAKSLTDEEREHIREYYRSLNFKEFLAGCPIEGVELARELTYPREVEL
ncbi:MAG: hypothetical protein OXL37_15495 [Chloroflexota bacterium]|nr:hypothetical protein [Chloroflexota bacterium]MDE2961882.1 hypothetical protein [Chloroflexota bacterium]